MNTDVLGLTTRIVAAHVEHNEVEVDALPDLIRSVYRSILAVTMPEVKQTDAPTPAVPIKRSVFPDFIVCLEDGKKLKMLKRHLKVSYGLSPTDYRSKWGLPPDYPMVAPNYAATRSGLAKKLGLGRKWLAAQPDASVFISAITEAELRYGAALLPSGRRRAARQPR